MTKFRVENDSLGEVKVPIDRLWGAQTQRSLEHFCIGDDLIPREMIPAYAIEKKASALVNYRQGRLPKPKQTLSYEFATKFLMGNLMIIFLCMFG